jgi:hypothetical protein
VWISVVVPLAVLLATLLLQRLEAKLLRTPGPAEHPERPVARPGDPAAPRPFGPRPFGPPRDRRPGGPSARRAAI